MKNSRHKIAAVLALLIGIMSVIAGSSVLSGVSDPGYNVLQWLVIYNVAAGFVSLIVSILIWQKHRLGSGSSLLVIAAHALVLILLLTVFNEVVAIESIKAMTFRTIIWITIFILNIK